MSLLSKIKKVAKKLGKVMPVSAAMLPTKGGVAGALSTLSYGAPVAMPGLQSAGGSLLGSVAGMLGDKVGIPSALASSLATSFLPKSAGPLGALKGFSDAVNTVAPPGALLDYFTSDAAARKRRRMNPLNARAAKRAIRRIKAVRKITASIERALPKAASRRHHHH